MGKGRMLLGVDLGSYSLKVLQLGQSRHDLELEGIAMAAYPEGTFVDGVLYNGKAVVETLSRLLAELNTDRRQAAVSIGGPSVLIKHLTLPVMSHENALRRIRSESDQHFPWDGAEMVLDMHIMGRSVAAGAGAGAGPESGRGGSGGGGGVTMNVLLAAVKKTLVEERLQLVRDAGLEPVVVDLDIFAAFNAYEHATERLLPEGAVLLLNGGASTVNMAIISGGNLVFTRDLAMGGNLITEELEHHFQVGYEVAEEAKLCRRSFKEGGDWWSLEGKVIQPVIKSMAREILKSLTFFTDNHPGVKMLKVILAGGLARCPLFREVLRTMVGLPVEVVNPFGNLVLGTDDLIEAAAAVGPAGVVGLGLALRQSGEKVR